MALLEPDDRGLWCAAGGFHVDPWAPVPRAVLTHGHGDHARPGSGSYLSVIEGAPILRRRLGDDATIQTLAYGERLRIGDTTVSLHPAGHVLGSAQIRIEHAGEIWVVTGDYKRDRDPTCAPFEPVRCDVLVTEATFALPIYRWPDPAQVIDDIVAFWDEARDAGVPALLFCYALGKAQRILAELAARGIDRPVHAHGAMMGITDVYRASPGMAPMLELRSATDAKKKDLEGALVLSPLSARGTSWIRRFSKARSGFASGWMQVRGDRRRRAIARGFVLSDHADWPALLRTIDESGASRVLATHGFADALARYVRETRGIDAGVLATRYEGEAGAEPDEAP
ncbi:ligase-associated DNA damage response exonuclease [Sandaracinus amylolyticus]|uniref:ligase-associated DNA damage response exonuclease n=1 Tax=Sandaracinus amylolyticus TaxID=927083 RepID=UPI001F4054A3|nr:ligase-associated DNA damage response exonuclease [Sandaracinus amylolyticus]UJR83825.1 Hypothetical protein I5071_58960 [Sandaracinus amylolyticus]